MAYSVAYSIQFTQGASLLVTNCLNRNLSCQFFCSTIQLHCRDLAKGSKCVEANFREIAKNINQSSSTSMKLTFESNYATVV